MKLHINIPNVTVSIYKVFYNDNHCIVVGTTDVNAETTINNLYPLMTYFNMISEDLDVECSQYKCPAYSGVVRDNGIDTLRQLFNIGEHDTDDVKIEQVKPENFDEFVKRGASVMLAELIGDTYYTFDWRRDIEQTLKWVLDVK